MKAAVFAAILVLFCAPSNAQDAFVRQVISYPIIQQTVYFASADIGRSNFLASGAKWAPYSLDRTGPILMGIQGVGQSVARRENVSFLQNKTQFAVMGGYQWSLPKVLLGALIGGELDSSHDAERPEGRLYGGVRVQGELWSNPTAQSMVHATLIASSQRPSLWTRAAWGIDVNKGLYLGPEVSAYVTDEYQEKRLGAHLTGIAIGPLNLRLSGGRWSDSDDRRGFYGQFTGYVRM